MGGRIIRKEPSNRLPFPLIGKIKVGQLSEKGYPQSIDWFRADGKYASLFHEAYGEKPSTIQIVFPNDNPEQCCKEYYEYRDKAGKLVASGDGETFKVWNGTAYQDFTTEQFPDIMERIHAKYNSPTGWKITLTLNFIIPLVRGIMGCWQLTTKGSASSIPSIRDAYDTILENNGKVAGVIFDLSVKFAKSQKPGQSSKFPVVSLVPNESRENLEKITQARKPILLESGEK